VEIQLRRDGVLDIRQVEHCTFSDPSLWSYRRDGERAGRNLSAIWMTLKN
jgi:copper oxidase (laccase) domain-containing protein